MRSLSGLVVAALVTVGTVAETWSAPRAAGPERAEPEILALEADLAQAGADSADARRGQALGVSVGLPQIIALTWEIEPEDLPLRFQANLGSILAIWSANGRLLVVPNPWRVQPYAFAGGGTFFGFQIEDFDGWEPYVWMGYGLRVRIQRTLVFAEMSFIEGTDEVAGPGFGGGMLFRY